MASSVNATPATENESTKTPGESCLMPSEDPLTADCVCEEEPIKFNPPLYKQRYCAVADILKAYDVTSVVDFGIAECGALRYYKGVESVQHITGVDIDKELLLSNQCKVKPLTTDYIQPRKNPLTVCLLCGSLADYDTRVAGCDAVVMIEVIEHLNADVLEKLPPNVFGRINPDFVVMSTPNAEFNVLFPDFSGFRHPDHKFEWTQSEFKQWCGQVADQYSYDVTYSGVGEPPPGSTHLGPCTQIAIFCKKSCQVNSVNNQQASECDDLMPYELIVRQEHPHQDPSVTTDDKIVMEARYYINMLAGDYTSALNRGEIECDHWQDDRTIKIDLNKLLHFRRLSDLCSDKAVLRKLLVEDGVRFDGDSDVIIHPLDDADSCDDSDSSCSEESGWSENDGDSAPDRDVSHWNDVTGSETQGAESRDRRVEELPWQQDEWWDEVSDQHDQQTSPGISCSRVSQTSDGAAECEQGQFSDVEEDWSVTDTHPTGGLACKTTQLHYNQTGSRSGSIQQSQGIVVTEEPQNRTHCTSHSHQKTTENCNTNLPPSHPEEAEHGNTDGCDLSLCDSKVNVDSLKTSEAWSPPLRADLDSRVNCQALHEESTLIVCRGCGCQMTKLVNCDNLCGLSARCRTSFSQRFRTALEIRTCTDMYTRTVPDQFSDAY